MFAATAARTHLRRFAASALAHASARCALTTAVPRGAGWSWVSSLGSCTHHPRTAVAAVTSAHLLGRASEFRGMGFHSSTVMATADVPGSYEDKELSQVLDEELKHETETYEASETIQAGPPEPWVFADDEGSCEIMLTRTYGEDEDIAVVFNVSEDPYDDEDTLPHMPGEDEEEGDRDEDLTIQFDVTVSRADGQESLEFACATDGATVEVRNVRYHAQGPEGAEYGLSSYPGPNYDELDETLQEEFHKYLEARGIDESLANFIMESHLDKEQKEYMGWLRNVSNFVGGKKQ